MELKLGIPKSTIHYITNRLIYLKLIRSITVVPPFNPKTPGQRPFVWGLEGAPAECSVECISRYYGLLSPVRVNGIGIKYSDVIQDTMEHFRARGMIGTRKPSQFEVGAYIKREHSEVEGPQRANLAGQIGQMLYKEFARI
jgi:hypothetical protein